MADAPETATEPEPDSAPDSALEQAPASPGGSAPKARRSLATTLGWVLAGVFAVTAILLAIVAAGLQSDLDATEDDRREVEAAGSRFVQAFVDYEAGDVATLRDDVLPLSADPFTEQFEAGVAQIQSINEALGRSSQATITDVFVAEVEGDQATVIVVYDSVETFADREPIPYENLYLRLGLVRLEGEWRVNDVLNLNFALSDTGGTGTPGAAGTTTTTAPAG